jgi:hypothetical protein
MLPGPDDEEEEEEEEVCYLRRLSTVKIIVLGGKPVPVPLCPP